MNNPEDLFEKLMNDEISREDFERLLEGLDDPSLLQKYDQYLQARFEEEIHWDIEMPEEPDARDDQSIKLPAAGKPENPKQKPTKNIKDFPIAASVILMIGIVFTALFVISQFRPEDESNLSSAESTYPVITKSTPNKRMFRMRLSDGSFVHMNAVSTISYPQQFESDRREIEISGEAYFDIERDENRPFNIKVRDYEVTVLGTSFNVVAYPDEDEFAVSVESGTVQVNLNDRTTDPIVLTNNQKLIYSPDTGKLKIMEMNAEDELSWRRGILRFDATPMARVEKMLERWYGVEILVQDSSIYNKTLSGVHQNENLKSVIEALTYATGTKYLISENKIIIKN